MDKKQKCESNNQWAGANISLTSQTNVKEKDENVRDDIYTVEDAVCELKKYLEAKNE